MKLKETNTTMILSLNTVNGKTKLVVAINSNIRRKCNSEHFEYDLPINEDSLDYVKRRSVEVADVFKSSSLDFPEEYGATKEDVAAILNAF